MNLLWSENDVPGGGASDREAHCEWLERQTAADPRNRIKYQAYNPAGLDEFIKSCRKSLEDPFYIADRAKAKATRRNMALACRIRSLAEPGDECSFPDGVEGITNAPIAMFRHIQRASAYGRTYHSGVNLQSAPKALRAALLGPCWEVDIQSAVWRHCSFLAGELGVERPPALLLMLEDRAAFRKRIAEDTMGDIPQMRHAAPKAVKEALTAIGFTAKVSHDVHSHPTALQDIITNKEARGRFRGHAHVKQLAGFVQDLLAALKKDSGHSRAAEELIGTIYGKKVRWPNYLAWLYQQQETRMRRAMIEALEKNGWIITLECHDGVYAMGPGQAGDIAAVCGSALRKLWRLPNGLHASEYPKVSVARIPQFRARMTHAERKAAEAGEREWKAVIAADEAKAAEAARRADRKLPDFISVGGVPLPDPHRAAALEAMSAETGLPPGIIDYMARRKERDAEKDAEKESGREAMRRKGFFEVDGEWKSSDSIREALLAMRAGRKR